MVDSASSIFFKNCKTPLAVFALAAFPFLSRFPMFVWLLVEDRLSLGGRELFLAAHQLHLTPKKVDDGIIDHLCHPIMLPKELI